MKKETKRNLNIREEVGFAMIEAMENAYARWSEKKTEGLRKRVLTWRLRLRLRFNHKPELLAELDEQTNIGLFDEEVGPLFDDVEREEVWGGLG